MSEIKEEFLNLNRIGKMILAESLRLGADTAACSASEGEKREFNVDGGEFSLFRTLYTHSVSVTVYKKGRKGGASVNKFDEESIKQAVLDAISAADCSEPDEAWEIAPFVGVKYFKDGPAECDTVKLFDRSEELLRDIKNRHPLIIVEQMIVSYDTSRSVYMSSTGNEYYSQNGDYCAEIMYSAHEGQQCTSFNSSFAVMNNLDTAFIDCGFIEKDLSDTEKQLNPESTEGKYVGTVVFSPGCYAEMISCIISNFAAGGVILDGTSIWKDKLNTKVADERITVCMNPFDSRIVSGSPYTGEGYIAEPFNFIEKGVLKQFVINKYISNKTGFQMAPNDSGSLIIEGGDENLDEIIKGIDRGILVGRFSGGEPGANGEFSGVAKNSFVIENGKIGSAAAETMISGNLADMINNLVGLSSETLKDGTMVVPYAAFRGITISGQ